MKTPFGNIDGKEVFLFTLKNSQGTKVKLTNYGATIVSIEVADRDKNIQDVVLGYDNLEQYQNDTCYFGSAVGPCPGRVSNAMFVLDENEYPLEKNNEDGHLHSGSKGFSKRVWQVKKNTDTELVLHHKHRHLDSGYPGNIDVWITYTLDEKNRLTAVSKAVTDRKSIFNITYHPYFNLKGAGKGDILDHKLTIKATKLLDMLPDWTPSGDFMDVINTPFDFTSSKNIGEDLHMTHPLLELTNGYDQAFQINKPDNTFGLIASVYEPVSGRVLDVESDMPTVVFYTGNYLENIKGKNDTNYKPQWGFCLEPQHHTNAVNIKSFPSIVIDSEKPHISKTRFSFSVKT